MQRNNNPERLPVVAAADFVKRQTLFTKVNTSYAYYNDNAPLSMGSLVNTCAKNGTSTLLSVAQM